MHSFYGYCTEQSLLAEATVKNYRRKVLLPICPFQWQQAHSDQKKGTRCFVSVVTYTISIAQNSI